MNTLTQQHRAKVLRNPQYWVSKIQLELYRHIHEFLKGGKGRNALLAKKLEVTPGYISQITNGNFDHKLSKFVELLYAVGKVPIIRYENIEDIIKDETRAQAKPIITVQAPIIVSIDKDPKSIKSENSLYTYYGSDEKRYEKIC